MRLSSANIRRVTSSMRRASIRDGSPDGGPSLGDPARASRVRAVHAPVARSPSAAHALGVLLRAPPPNRGESHANRADASSLLRADGGILLRRDAGRHANHGA